MNRICSPVYTICRTSLPSVSIKAISRDLHGEIWRSSMKYLWSFISLITLRYTRGWNNVTGNLPAWQPCFIVKYNRHGCHRPHRLLETSSVSNYYSVLTIININQHHMKKKKRRRKRKKKQQQRKKKMTNSNLSKYFRFSRGALPPRVTFVNYKFIQALSAQEHFNHPRLLLSCSTNTGPARLHCSASENQRPPLKLLSGGILISANKAQSFNPRLWFCWKRLNVDASGTRF